MDEAKAPTYLRQDCGLSVTEALDEFYRANPDAVRETGDPLRDNFFRAHDTIHVVFGCATNIHDEVLADSWTIFGSDLGFRNYLKYLEPLQDDLKDIARQLGIAQMIWQSVKAVPDVVRVFARSRAMAGKWHWQNHESYLELPLKDLRAQLNIAIID